MLIAASREACEVDDTCLGIFHLLKRSLQRRSASIMRW